jgi:hypothetical protein
MASTGGHLTAEPFQKEFRIEFRRAFSLGEQKTCPMEKSLGY